MTVTMKDAEKYIFGYSVFLDITARDLQNEAKKKGLPWSVSKGFDTFAPIGPKVVPKEDINIGNLEIWLKVNGETKQRGNTGDMIFSVPYLISYISGIMTLEPGDVIATGTPSGVGPLHPGDIVEGYIEGIGILREKVVKER